jgi:excisionase family DNA binding protein
MIREEIQEEQILTTGGVSNLLKVSKQTVISWTKQGILKKYLIGETTVRYKLSEVLKALNPLVINPQNLNGHV